MKIRPDTDLKAFMLSVSRCRKDVLFVTEEGDQLNLRSELSRYLFAAVVNHPQLLQKGRLEFSDATDALLLAAFITN